MRREKRHGLSILFLEEKNHERSDNDVYCFCGVFYVSGMSISGFDAKSIYPFNANTASGEYLK